MDNITDEQHEKILLNLWKQNKIDKTDRFFDFFVALPAIVLAIGFVGAFMSMIIKILN